MGKIAAFLFLVFASPGNAGERSAEEWIEELSTTYAKLDGFIATYVSVGEGKRLEVTVALDEASQKALVHMQAEKGGEEVVMKQWSTGPDEIYLSANGELVKAEGLKAMMERQIALLMKPFADVAPGEELVSNAALSPAFHLTREQVSMGLGFAPADKPTWASEVEGAEVEAVDEESVTFRTEELGLFVISRGNGLLVRQSLRGLDGEPRDLELQHAVINPGEEAVAAISRDWPVDGAKAFGPPNGMFAGLRLKFFQLLIREIERANLEVGELERRLEQNRQALLELAASCVNDQRAILRDDVMDQIVKKNAMEALRKWENQGHDKAEAEELLRRQEFRDIMIRGLHKALGREAVVHGRLLAEIIGTTGIGVEVAKGKEAKAHIEKALAAAYLEILLRRSLDRVFGPVID